MFFRNRDQKPRKRARTITDLVDVLIFEEEREEASWEALLSDREPKPLPRVASPVVEAPRTFFQEGVSHHFWWGGIHLPITAAKGHALFVGTTGSGKSQLLNIALGQILQTITPGSERRAIIFDTKGDVLDILTGMGIPYTLMNINDERAAAWDLAKDCQSYTKADEISFILLPKEKHGEQFWSDAARALVAGVLFTFIYQHGSDWGLHDVVNALLSDKETLIKILSQFPQNKALIEQLLSTEAEKTEAGVRMQLFTAMKRLLPAAAHSQNAKRKFSLREFFEAEGVLVIAPDLEARETVNPIAQAMFRRLTDINNASSDSDTRQTFVFIDEARFLGKLPGLLDLLTFGRSKGACVFLSTQVIEGLYELYGKDEAEEIFGNCNFKTILRANSPVTVEWATRLFGSVEMWETIVNSQEGQGGLSISQNKQRSKRERVLDSEILRLPLATRENGIHAFFISPLTDAYKEVIPGDVIQDLQPPKCAVPRQVSKPKEAEILRPWTEAEREKFVNPSKAPTRQQQPPGAVRSVAQEVWLSDLRDCVWETLAEITAELAADYFEYVIQRNDEGR